MVKISNSFNTEIIEQKSGNNPVLERSADVSIFNGEVVEEIAEETLSAKNETTPIEEIPEDFDEISKADLKTLNNKLASEIKIDTPEEMFKKNVNTDTKKFGTSLDDYIIKLDAMISIKELLKNNEIKESEQKIKEYKNDLDDLVKDSTQIDKNLKDKYNQKLQKKRELAEKQKQYDISMQQKQEELQLAEANLEKFNSDEESQKDEQTGKNLYANLQNAQEEYSDLFKQNKDYSARINNIDKQLSKLRDKVTKTNSSLKIKIDEVNKKIRFEEKTLEQNTEMYDNEIGQLNTAKEYAIQQMSSEAVAKMYARGSYSDADTEGTWTASAEELKAKWSKKGKHLSDEFYKKVVAISGRLGCDPNALMGIMNAESGINSKAINHNGGATGLIQFMPRTAKGYGTSTAELYNMSAEEQLTYVEKYLTRAKRSAGFKNGEKMSAGQVYALVFLPARARREVLTTSNESYYRANSKTDTNGDGMITKSELDQRARKFMA